MARPKFHIQHFIACLSATWQGPPSSRTYHDLEGVSHIYTVPPGTEAPEFAELWLYTRMYLMNGAPGDRAFSIEVARKNDPDDSPALGTYAFDPITFRAASVILNVSWALRPVRFPTLGDYVIRLLCEFNTWDGPRKRVVAREFIRIE